MDENLCPECSSKMVSRKRKSDGVRFWGCSRFPQCKGTRDSDGNSRQDRAKARENRDKREEETGGANEVGFMDTRWDRD